LLIMKDVLQHLPNDEIIKFRDVLLPRFRFCLIANSFEKVNTQKNVDITVGSFRCLDLTLPPYNFRGCYILEFGSAAWERIRVLLLSNSA